MVKFNMVGLGSIQAYPRTHYKPAVIFMFRTSPIVKEGEMVDFRQVTVEESNLDGLEELGKMLLAFVDQRRKKKAADLAKAKEPPVPDPRKAANREEEAGESGGGGT